jgi:hypothetical protein
MDRRRWSDVWYTCYYIISKYLMVIGRLQISDRYNFRNIDYNNIQFILFLYGIYYKGAVKCQ